MLPNSKLSNLILITQIFIYFSQKYLYMVKMTINMLISVHTWWKKGLAHRTLRFWKRGTWLLGLYWGERGLRRDLSWQAFRCMLRLVLDKHPRLWGSWNWHWNRYHRGTTPILTDATGWKETLSCKRQHKKH